MTKNFSILFLTMWLSMQLFAQTGFKNPEKPGQESNRLGEKLTGTIYYINTVSNSNFFLHQEWLEGTILLENGDLFEDQRLRFMSRNNELVAYNKNLKNLFIVDKKKVKRFTLFAGGDTLRFIKLYYEGFVPGERYFEELYGGRAFLLAFHDVEDRKTLPFRDETGTLRDTYYTPATRYYLYSEAEGFSRLQVSRRSFYAVFPGKKKQVRKLFRRNKLRVFDEQGMIRAFQLLDKAGFFN